MNISAISTAVSVPLLKAADIAQAQLPEAQETGPDNDHDADDIGVQSAAASTAGATTSHRGNVVNIST